MHAFGENGEEPTGFARQLQTGFRTKQCDAGGWTAGKSFSPWQAFWANFNQNAKAKHHPFVSGVRLLMRTSRDSVFFTAPQAAVVCTNLGISWFVEIRDLARPEGYLVASPSLFLLKTPFWSAKPTCVRKGKKKGQSLIALVGWFHTRVQVFGATGFRVSRAGVLFGAGRKRGNRQQSDE